MTPAPLPCSKYNLACDAASPNQRVIRLGSTAPESTTAGQRLYTPALLFSSSQLYVSSVDRRSLLTATAGSLVSGLAGCTGILDRDQDDPQGIRLESLDVGGSPGGPVDLRPADKVVLLDFFATWCAPCKPEMENLRAARSRYSPDSVFILSITQETDEAAIKEFWREYNGTWPVVIDANLEATEKYEVTGIPTIIIFSPAGSRVMRHTGLAGEDKLLANLDAALAGTGAGER